MSEPFVDILLPRTSVVPGVVRTSSAAERDVVEGNRPGVDGHVVMLVDYGTFTATARQPGSPAPPGCSSTGRRRRRAAPPSQARRPT